jgi:hypothetical protein
MRAVLVAPALLVAVAGLSPAPAAAKGCIKGAVVGGVAGHYAGHHGLAGAAAGCVVGHHMANKHATGQAQPGSVGSSSSQGSGNTAPSDSGTPSR